MTWLIIFGIIAVLAIWGVGIYNSLVGLRNAVKNAWSQIDVQLQRRYDLIPNLIESVKGYMAHERGTLEAVINARNQAATARQSLAQAGGPTAESIKTLMGAETALKGAMGNFFALAENYPQLKANENMRMLQDELAATESQIAFARQGYNNTAMAYNNAQQQFPAVLLASTFGHQPVEMFEVQEQEARKAVKVQF
ncbi:MAG: LemA family protein [Parachlamydia sp.]|nr:LemA family protein [Parachlamydia sp.]